jgi:hypothetical protein
VLYFAIHLFMYGLNTLSAVWIGPHITYSYYFLFYIEVVNPCVPFTFSLPDRRRYAAWTIEWYDDTPLTEATVAMRRIHAKDARKSCYERE